ncbi:MAG: hypothetical protein ACREUG_00730 [Steroidobacteraceae bacterium]
MNAASSKRCSVRPIPRTHRPNTSLEKGANFFKRLLPLLEFGRERESVDLSEVVLTHHTLREQRQIGRDRGGARIPVR